jgi:hypothetical protein
MKLTTKTAWELFREQRVSRIADLKKRLARRGNENYWLVDALHKPLLKDCYQLPFFFTDMSCSGHPADHGERKYFSAIWDGRNEGPQGYLVMSLFAEHPLAQPLHEALSRLEGNDVAKSGRMHIGGFYDHVFQSWNTLYVPEQNASSGDMTYLPKVWGCFHSAIREFIKQNDGSANWNWAP